MAGQSFGPRRSSPPGPGPARKLEPRRTFPSVSTTTKRTKRKEQKKTQLRLSTLETSTPRGALSGLRSSSSPPSHPAPQLRRRTAAHRRRAFTGMAVAVATAARWPGGATARPPAARGSCRVAAEPEHKAATARFGTRLLDSVCFDSAV